MLRGLAETERALRDLAIGFVLHGPGKRCPTMRAMRGLPGIRANASKRARRTTISGTRLSRRWSTAARCTATCACTGPRSSTYRPTC
jgi:hypothetical protein